MIVPSHEEDRSGWYGTALHIYAPACVKTPAWASHERLGIPADKIVVADCCLCKMRADETICQVVTGPEIPKGLSDDEYRDRIWDFYFEPYVTINCADGFGCTVNKRRRSSRHLREGWYEYA